MQLTGVSLPIQKNTLVNVHRVNQSIGRHKGTSQGDKQNLNRDNITISLQGRVSSLIENLTKQKMDITERKGQFLASAIERGQSMDAIQSQLDLYDEQIKDIDKQISEITAQQMKTEVEKQRPKVRDAQPKTKEDIQNQKLANVTKMSVSLDKIDTIEAIKTKVDGEIGVLKSEIEVDKTRSEGMTGSQESIEKKEDLLSKMETQSLDLTAEIGHQLSGVSKIVDENNDLTLAQVEEDIDDSHSDDIVNKSKNIIEPESM